MMSLAGISDRPLQLSMRDGSAARRLLADLGHEIEGLLDGKEFKQTAYARP